MSQNNLIKYVSVPGKTIMVFMILLAATAFLQLAVPAIINGLFLGEKAMQPSAPEETKLVTRQERIHKSEKEFLPDGTIHLVYRVPPAKDDQRRDTDFSEYRQRTVKVYDANDTLIWSGDYSNRPFPLYSPRFFRLGTVEIYDADDKLLWRGDYADRPYVYLPQSLYSGGADLVSEGHLERVDNLEFSRLLMIPVVSTERKIVQRWRYDPIHRYFIGFDLNGRRIGFAGTNGVKKTRKEIEPFEEFRCMTAWCSKYSDSPIVLWQTVHALHQISFEKEIFELLYEIPDARFKPVFSLNNWMGFERDYEKFENEQRREYYKNIYESRPTVQLYTEDGGHYLLLRDPVERIKLDLSDELAMGWTRIIIHKDRILLRYEGPKEKPDPIKFKPCKYCAKYHNYNPAERKVELYSVDSSGSLKLINSFAWTRPKKYEERIAAVERFGVYWHHGMGDYITTVSPLLYEMAWHFHYSKYQAVWRLWEFYHSNFLSLAVFEFLDGFHPTNIQANCSLTVLLMLATLWHAWSRRTSWGRFVFWLVFVTAFNLAGFLTYLAVSRHRSGALIYLLRPRSAASSPSPRPSFACCRRRPSSPR